MYQEIFPYFLPRSELEVLGEIRITRSQLPIDSHTDPFSLHLGMSLQYKVQFHKRYNVDDKNEIVLQNSELE